MNNDLKKLEQRLEQATAPCNQAENELDPETAALRAGWLALDELLEGALPEVDLPACSRPLQPVRSKRRRWLATLAALAASALVTFLCVKNLPVTNPAADSQAPALAKNEPSSDSAPTPLDAKEIAWDDSFDQEVELTGLAIQMARSDQLALASSSGGVGYQLEVMQMDIEDNSL